MNSDSVTETQSRVLLEEMQVEFEIDGRTVSAPAKVVLALRPIPDVAFEVWDVPRDLRRAAQADPAQLASAATTKWMPMLSEGPATIQLDNGRTVEILPNSWMFSQTENTLYASALPCVGLDTGHPLERMQFSVMNFSPRVRHQYLHLEAPPWKIIFDPVSNLGALRETQDTDRGFAITHHGTIVRTDNSPFSVKEATELLDALNTFLSFVCGTFCSPLNVTGLDSNDDEAWKRWGPHYISPWSRPRSWFDITISQALSNIFKVFWQEYRRDPQGQGRIVRWYAHSNENNVADVSMILNQVALEALSNTTVGAKPNKKLTGEWIADALRCVGINPQIPAFCSELNRLATQESWKHGPHALVTIRNDMVHSNITLTNISLDAYFEAWQLGLWYLELMLLQRFGYSGEYANRLTPVQMPGATEPVPWI